MKKSVFTMATFLFALLWGWSTNVIAQNQTYSVTLIQPKSTDTWVAGTAHLISWTDNLTKPVAIYIDINDGNGFVQIGPANVYGSTWTWNIPANIVSASTTARIKIQSTVDDNINSGDNNTFTLAPSSADKEIQIQQPTANDSWAVNSKHLISWSKNFSGSVDVYLEDPGDNPSEKAIVEDRWGNSYTWTVGKNSSGGDLNLSSIVAPNNTYTIKIYKHDDHNVEIESDQFTIVSHPSDAEITIIQPNDLHNTIQWAGGTTHLISWTNSLGGSVDIIFKRYNTTTTQYEPKLTLQNVYGSTKSWYIDTTNTPTGTYKMTIQDHNYPDVTATSAAFEITHSSPDAFITVEQPNDVNIQWAVNSKHLISWSKNFSGTVDIYLVKTSDNSEQEILANRWGNSYPWTVGKDSQGHDLTIVTGDTYKIKIYKHGDHTNVRGIGAAFTIVSHPVGAEIVIKQPNDANIVWAKGTSHLISWTNTLPGPVNIYIKKTTDANYPNTPLYSNVYGSTKTWYISNSIDADTYTMIIKDVNYPDVVSPESAQFQIIEQPKIDVYPNPSTTSVTVQFNENSNGHYVMTLYNRYNMRVMSKPVNTSTTKQVRINTFNLPNGVYFLRLVSGKEVISKKIVVQH